LKLTFNVVKAPHSWEKEARMRQRSWFGSPATLVRPLVLAISLLTLDSCGSDAAEKEAVPEDAADAPARRVLLTNLATKVILPSYEEADRQARALQSMGAALAEKPSDAAALGAAQDAWKKAMLAWQRAEVLQVGPAASQTPIHPGGRTLRDRIYFFPGVNACGIDRCLVTKCYAAKDFAESSLPDVRGLATLERLLFDAGTTTSCPADNTIVTAKAWQDLAAELPARRAAYAAACAADVAKATTELVSTWKNGFLHDFTQAGEKSDTFATTREALSALVGALFYVSAKTKDLKLGRPVFCTADDCATRTEHAFAKISKEAIAVNLAALADIFDGKPPANPGTQMWGLYDLAESTGANTFPGTVQQLVYDAQIAVDAIPGSLEDAIAAEAPEAMMAFDALEALAGRLKTDLPDALDVPLPAEVEQSH
jgi:predicted lipoprotein